MARRTTHPRHRPRPTVRLHHRRTLHRTDPGHQAYPGTRVTTPRTLHRQLAHIRIEAAIIGYRLPTILAHLNTITPDGYPTTASGADTGPHGNTVNRPTERTAIHRAEHDTLNELDDYIRTARHALTLTSQLLDHIGAPPTTLGHLRCTGCQQWADPARNDGQCLDCGRRTDTDQRRARRRTQTPA